MAQIAEDLFLLLVDNATAQPSLERQRRERVLAAGVLLDLAWACRLRPSAPGDAVEQGRLVALQAGSATDPVGETALALLQKQPLTPERAVAKVGKGVQDTVALHLERLGQISRVRVPSSRFNRLYAWPLIRRERVAAARADLLAALFDRRPPTPATAAVVTVLHAADGLGALLSLNDRGWRWVHSRATEISSGSWVDEYPTALPEVNLAITASALRSALS
ncbi:GPP34 family phosphoprotein [Mycolicibacterium sp. P1-18]|uniref:GOLPH3/VPS74 family protein n=1 Tax=Mycolicibacterium sp. P1-18 TaxID=2024615 RepID=UPI0011F16C4C|nr:GPP34 family phosphoprotein [Mycolicibacterium sp. P1-18]KAA0095418.1 GPP34 family phosphoprotein [Mycolicibacterium sp. P1-18]